MAMIGIAGDKRYETAAMAEIAKWPGVTAKFTKTSRHAYCILSFNGKSKKAIYPVTGSDRKGPLNHCQDIRGILREMGAVPAERQVAAERPKKKKAKPSQKAIKPNGDLAQRPDTWAGPLDRMARQMAEGGPAAPTINTMPWWARVWRFVRHAAEWAKKPVHLIDAAKEEK